MFEQSIIITLLHVACTLVHCAHNNTELSSQFLEKCCDIANGNKSVCHLSNLNCTSTMTLYDSFRSGTGDSNHDHHMSDCTASFENISQVMHLDEKINQKGNKQQEYVNAEGRTNAKRTDLKGNDETIRICKVCSSNGNNGDIHNDNSNKTITINNTFNIGQELWLCDSVFTSLNFWGANIVIFANMIYIIPYLFVVLVYLFVRDLGRRAYNKAVICYNISQLILNAILIGIGACVLCHLSINSNIYIFSGLIIMFLTISSTFWLLVICIDMTLVITRFYSTSSTKNTKANMQLRERKKFFTYAAWTWGSSLLPTALACIAELSPLFSTSSPFRPNFQKFQDGANLSVIIYVVTFPVITCFANSVLFCYTSYKMILIQKSTTLATANNATLNVNKARRRYFLFLRLYLLMDTPWITSALAAVFTELWVLKFLRMIQPILMLLAILPPQTISRTFVCNCLHQNRILTFSRRVP